MANTRMTVRKPDTTTLTPTAVDKFATAARPGRVINVDAETVGGGTAAVQLVHPDGTVEKLADLAVPKLAPGERCALRVRLAACVRGVNVEDAAPMPSPIPPAEAEIS